MRQCPSERRQEKNDFPALKEQPVCTSLPRPRGEETLDCIQLICLTSASFFNIAGSLLPSLLYAGANTHRKGNTPSWTARPPAFALLDFLPGDLVLLSRAAQSVFLTLSL